jgi:MFS transporter, SP family, solute carrier family 2 (myo-inositol transporter), member 13
MNDTPNCWPLLVTGPGGRLSEVDVGIIAGALPYLEETSGLNASRLSIMAATTWLGRMITTLLANLLTGLLGRETLLISIGAVFVLSNPMFALAHSFGPLVHGRLPKEMGLPERFMQPKLTKRLGQA